MAAGSVILTAAGKRRLSPSGKLQLSDGVTTDPCGCCGCLDCDNCVSLAQDTPCKVLLTISGLTLCAICHIDIIGGQWASWDVGADFDGSYCLTEVVTTPCTWRGTITGVPLTVYTDSSCSVPLKTISTWTVEVSDGFGGPIGFDCFLYNDADGDGTRTVINAPSFAVGADCVSGGSGTPTAGVCNAASTNLASAGGTWTATPNAC